MAITPDGCHMVSCARHGGGTVRIWSMTTGEQVADIQAPCRLCSIAVSPDGREVMCGCDDKTVRVWSICTGEDGTIDGYG